MSGDDDAPEDRPEELPVQPNAADPKDFRKRETKRKRDAREQKEFLQRLLSDPAGRRFIWSILEAAGTFDDRYGFGPTGFPNNEATWAFRGQKDLGLRFYHTWSITDRAGMLALLDEFHSQFPKGK